MRLLAVLVESGEGGMEVWSICFRQLFWMVGWCSQQGPQV